MEVSTRRAAERQSHFREAMWKSKMYRNTQLEFKAFIVLVHLSRLEKQLEAICQKLLGRR